MNTTKIKVEQVTAYKVDGLLIEDKTEAEQYIDRKVIQSQFDEFGPLEGASPVQYSEFEEALKQNVQFREAVARLCIKLTSDERIAAGKKRK